MPKTGLFGPHPLTKEGIDEHVTGLGPGAYALGELNLSGVFEVAYVGRSDDDLNKRLHDHENEYPAFRYAFYESAEQAYRKECRLYHTFTPFYNTAHPAKPADSDFTCPWPECGG